MQRKSERKNIKLISIQRKLNSATLQVFDLLELVVGPESAGTFATRQGSANTQGSAGRFVCASGQGYLTTARNAYVGYEVYPSVLARAPNAADVARCDAAAEKLKAGLGVDEAWLAKQLGSAGASDASNASTASLRCP